MHEQGMCRTLTLVVSVQIEKYVMHVLEQEADSSSPSLLSPEELVFAKE